MTGVFRRRWQPHKARRWVTSKASASGITGAANITLGSLTAAGAGTVTISGSAAITLGGLSSSAAGAVAIKGRAGGTLATFTDGYGGDTNTGQDTMLVSGAPTIAFGTHDVYDVSTSRVWLERFVLDDIPADAFCVSATVHYFKTSAVPNAQVTCTLYHVSDANGDWIEGVTYGGLASSGEPCWNAKKANGSGGVTEAWTGSAGLSTSGVDYDAAAIGSFIIPANAQVGDEYTCTLDETTVASWFGKATNNGILMRASGSAEYIGSSEHATTGYRPYLEIEYSTAITLGSLTLSGTGAVLVSGSASITLGTLTASGTGVVGSTPVTGQATITLGSLTSAGAGAVAVVGSATITLGTLTVSGNGYVGNVPVVGSADITLGTLTVSGAGTVAVQGTASISLGTLTASGAGAVAVTGSAAITLGALTASGSGITPITGQLAVTLGALILVATGADLSAVKPGRLRIENAQLNSISAADVVLNAVVIGDV